MQYVLHFSNVKLNEALISEQIHTKILLLPVCTFNMYHMTKIEQ